MTDSESEESGGGSAFIRSLRGIVCMFLGNPVTVLVVALTTWFLIHVCAGAHALVHHSEPWAWADLFTCVGCMAALMIIILGAVGHLVLMFLSGMRKEHTDPSDNKPPRT